MNPMCNECKAIGEWKDHECFCPNCGQLIATRRSVIAKVEISPISTEAEEFMRSLHEQLSPAPDK